MTSVNAKSGYCQFTDVSDSQMWKSTLNFTLPNKCSTTIVNKLNNLDLINK